MWHQKTIHLTPRPRGFHLVTAEVVEHLPELRPLRCGLLHLFLQHTSAALSLNENADPTVRRDFSRFFDQLVPDGAAWIQHRDEGPDDMPAHIKSSLIGASLSIPITDGCLNLGTWQGIYLCEFRLRGGSRTLLATVQGQGA